MENFRLSSINGGLLSIILGILPDVGTINTWTDIALKFFSLCSVLLIIFLNLKKLRSNATA